MKVLVATREKQGMRHNDFTYTNDGELVYFGFECTREQIDGQCGCRRSMVGIHTSKATTTFKVAEVPMTGEEYEQALRMALVKDGWYALAGTINGSEVLAEKVRRDAAKLRKTAGGFPVGTVLERRGQKIRERDEIKS